MQRADSLDRLLRTVYPLARVALTYDLPEARKHAKALMQQLERARGGAIVRELEVIDAHKASLELLLKRTASQHTAGPTPEWEQQQQARRPARAQTALEVLKAKGTLTSEAENAAEEIQSIAYGVTKSLFAKTPNLESSTAGQKGSVTQPVTTLPAGLSAAYSKRYLPWCDEQKRLPVTTAIEQGSRLELVWNVLIDGWGLRQADRKYGVRNGRCAEIVVQALERYWQMGESERSAMQARARAEAPLIGTRGGV